MVKFGERLAALRQPGWEQHYVDYESLKQLIDMIETQPSTESTQRFRSELTSQLNRVTASKLKLKFSARVELGAFVS
jgi:SPX domain protein involved in polyphosphate accumulation